MKNKLICGLSILFMLIALGAFLFSCVVIPTDAQGIFIFIFTLPIILVALALAYLTTRNSLLTSAQAIWLKRVNKIVSIFILMFFVSAPIPVLNFYPAAIVLSTSKVFELMVGMPARDWFKQRNNPH